MRLGPGELAFDDQGRFLGGFRKVQNAGLPALEASFGYGCTNYVVDADHDDIDPPSTMGEIDLTADSPLMSLPADLCADQAGNTGTGVSYEAYPDPRLGGSVPASYALQDSGEQSYQAGSVLFEGPTHSPPSGLYPYVMHESARNFFALHPGNQTSSGTHASAAAVRFEAPAYGVYRIVGAFARANDSQGLGDGVDVAIFKNADVSTPVFSASISAAHPVDPDDPFSGTGSEPFDEELTLNPGDVLRFVVYPGGPGSSNIDYDVAALRVAIYRTAECSDGLDNDGDGQADYPDDTGCESADDLTEDVWSPGFATSTSDVLRITGTEADDCIGVSLTGNSTYPLAVTNLCAGMRAGEGCAQFGPMIAVCADATAAEADLLGGDDSFWDGRVSCFDSFATSLVWQVNGGAGDDNICSGHGSIAARGGSGDDVLVANGGTTTLFAYLHNVLLGGEGDDTLTGGPFNDALDGGAGVDALTGGDNSDLLVSKDGETDGLVDCGAGGDGAIVDTTDAPQLCEAVSY
jgi:hypothetical protein